jgi:peptidoglycan/xylan/chitin deacetylase (PgdA/CDA1 family)
LKRWLCLGLLLGALAGPGLRAAEPKTLTVLCYHRFGVETELDPYKISLQRLGQQLDWLKDQGYQSVSLAQVAQAVSQGAGALPSKALLLSVDDGYKAGALGAAEFEKRGFHAVYFVITGTLGKGSYMDWDACRELERRGHEVASHTLTHENLAKPEKGQTPQQYKAWVNQEFRASRARLEKELGHPVTAMAYPYGAYNPAVSKAALDAGYTLHFTVSDGVNLSDSLDPQRLRRILFMGHPSQEAFVRRMEKRPVPAAFPAMQDGALFLRSAPALDLHGLPADLKLSVDGQEVRAFPTDQAPGFHFLVLDQGPRETKLLFQIARDDWAPYFDALTEN